MTYDVLSYAFSSKTAMGRIIDMILLLLACFFIQVYLTIPKEFTHHGLYIYWVAGFAFIWCIFYHVLSIVNTTIHKKKINSATRKSEYGWLLWQKENNKTNFDLANEIARAWEMPQSNEMPQFNTKVLVPCLLGCNYTTHRLTRSRAYRSPTRRSHNSSFSTSNDGGGSAESDSGDPPCSNNLTFHLAVKSQTLKFKKIKIPVVSPRLLLLGVPRGWAA